MLCSTLPPQKQKSCSGIQIPIKKKDDVKEKTPNNILNTSKQNTIKSFIIIHGEGNEKKRPNKNDR